MGDFKKGYRTLTVDKVTYDFLEEICKTERRKKIDQLRLLIEESHKELFIDIEKKLSSSSRPYQTSRSLQLEKLKNC